MARVFTAGATAQFMKAITWMIYGMAKDASSGQMEKVMKAITLTMKERGRAYTIGQTVPFIKASFWLEKPR